MVAPAKIKRRAQSHTLAGEPAGLWRSSQTEEALAQQSPTSGEYRNEAGTTLHSGSPEPSGGENEPNLVGNAPQSLPEALTLREKRE